MGPFRVLLFPTNPVLWAVMIVCGALAVALVFELTDAPASIRRGWHRIMEWVRRR
jgi:hypothetical protein